MAFTVYTAHKKSAWLSISKDLNFGMSDTQLVRSLTFNGAAKSVMKINDLFLKL